MPTPCTMALVVKPRLIWMPAYCARSGGIMRMAKAATATPSRLPKESQCQRLKQINSENLPRRRADALRNRDRLDLLLDEHPHDTRNRNSSENDNDEPHEAEVVLRPRQVLPNPILGAAVRADADELPGEIDLQSFDERLHFALVHIDQNLAPRTAAKRQQPGLLQRSPVDQHARAEVEGTWSSPSFL